MVAMVNLLPTRLMSTRDGSARYDSRDEPGRRRTTAEMSRVGGKIKRPAGVVREDRTGGRARFTCGSGGCVGLAGSPASENGVIPPRRWGRLTGNHLTRPIGIHSSDHLLSRVDLGGRRIIKKKKNLDRD